MRRPVIRDAQPANGADASALRATAPLIGALDLKSETRGQGDIQAISSEAVRVDRGVPIPCTSGRGGSVPGEYLGKSGLAFGPLGRLCGVDHLEH